MSTAGSPPLYPPRERGGRGTWCTPTRLEQYARCPWAFHEQYVNGVANPAGPAAERGAAIHEVMRQYMVESLGAGRYVGPERLGEIAAIGGVPSDGLGMLLRWEAVGRRPALEEIVLVDPAHDAGSADKWYPFELEAAGEGAMNGAPTEGLYLYGHPDLVAVTGARAQVIDWKSGFRIYDPATIQADAYALLAFAHWPQVVEVEFVFEFLRFGVRRVRIYPREEAAGLAGYIRGMVAGIRDRIAAEAPPYIPPANGGEEAWPAQPNEFCAGCAYLADRSCPIGGMRVCGRKAPMSEAAARKLAVAILMEKAREKRAKGRIEAAEETLEVWCEANRVQRLEVAGAPDGVQAMEFGAVVKRELDIEPVELARLCLKHQLAVGDYVRIDARAAAQLVDDERFAAYVREERGYSTFRSSKKGAAA